MNIEKDGYLDFTGLQSVNRTHKDRLFRLIFREKEDLLSLYNAVRGTDYQNPEDLTITTLEDAIYLGMKNDISFIIDSTMNLYEHQSTWSENMPLRGLIYFASLYQEYISRNSYNMYGSKRIVLPAPKYIVFYNGVDDKPDRSVMRLSEAFCSKEVQDGSCLECEAVILNINKGHNSEILDKCKRLWEYTEFVHGMRECMKRGLSVGDAASMVMAACLKQGILVDVLARCRTEVLEVLLTEYNEAETMAYLRREAQEIGWEEGRAAGMEAGIKEGRAAGREEGMQEGMQAGMQAMVESLLEESISNERIIRNLMKRFALSEEQANEYLAQFE